MTDDPTKKGIQKGYAGPHPHQYTSEDYELRYWCEKFDVPEKRLGEPVRIPPW